MRFFDEDGNTLISEAEFRKGLTGLGIKATKAEIKQLFGEIDTDHLGQMDHRKLAIYLHKTKRESVTVSSVQQRAECAEHALSSAPAGTPSESGPSAEPLTEGGGKEAAEVGGEGGREQGGEQDGKVDADGRDAEGATAAAAEAAA